MKLTPEILAALNQTDLSAHREEFDFLAQRLARQGHSPDKLTVALQALQVAAPSWALGSGGTRFGRFAIGGAPRSLEEKVDDVGLLHALTRAAGAISLHIPWDIPADPVGLRSRAAELGLVFDAVNSNTFQDQEGQALSYQFGSLCHSESEVRAQAVAHNLEVIRHGESLGSKSLTVWLADGSSFPGQLNFRLALERTLDSLQKICRELPDDWRLFIEYKPYEPSFYSTVIQDWGTSCLLAEACGEKAYCLVDLGHHLPNANIEQIVATLLWMGKLGGFHFNDSKYGDDDLTVGAIKPYQLYLIFNELVYGMRNNFSSNPPLAWMIDASHNLKDPIEDLIQSLEAIWLAYAQALITDSVQLESARERNDPAMAQEILQAAFRTDLRPLLREARLRAGGALYPLKAYRQLGVREHLIKERGHKVIATGL